MFRLNLHAASDELLHLDFLRILASIGIVMLHFSRFLSPGTQVALGPLGGLTILVDLFFAVSGFVIAFVYTGRITSGADYRTFLQRRIARLGPLHWAMFAVFLGLGILAWTGTMRTDHPENYDPRCIVPNVLAMHAWGLCNALSYNDVSWSISAEMGMYIIAPLLLVIGARSAPLLGLATIAVLAGLTFLSDQPWLSWTYHFGVARALPSFMLGIVMFQGRGLIARMPAPRIVAVAAMAVLLVGIHHDLARLWLLPIVYVIVAATIACDFSGRYPPLRIGALGQLTYSVYMIHPLVRTFVISFAGHRILKLHGAGADAMVFGALVLTIVLADLSFVYFETPARRWLGKRRTAAPAAMPA